MPSKQEALNGICPYFTMFPLEFPLKILRRRASEGDLVLDPFCGRGTTNFAARLSGLESLGVDTSPVATAITDSKLVDASPAEIMDEAQQILADTKVRDVPDNPFWRQAYHPSVLVALCKFREALGDDCSSSARRALRGIIMGALHGPKQNSPSYFSNQSPRTYAPKPSYATKFWKERGLEPELVDVLSVIQRRADRYFKVTACGRGIARRADSREAAALVPPQPNSLFDWVITSPPYYGMQTYMQDQWLRYWFVGGGDTIDYKISEQVVHSSRDAFAEDLRKVWTNTRGVCKDGARMVIRFGSIRNRDVAPKELIRASLRETGWRVTRILGAGTAEKGKRQANAFLREDKKSEPLEECDVWAIAD